MAENIVIGTFTADDRALLQQLQGLLDSMKLLNAQTAQTAKGVKGIGDAGDSAAGGLKQTNAVMTQTVGLLGKLRQQETDLKKARDIANDPASVKRYNQEIAGVQKQLASLESMGTGGGLAGFFSSQVGQITAAAVAFKAFQGIKDVGSQLITLAGDAEQTTISFEVMLKSAEKAKEMMSELAAFAARTPFQLPQVEAAAKQLLAFGIDSRDVLNILQHLGDVASATNTPLAQLTTVFGQVATAGRLMTQDMNQFTAAGVPLIAALSKQYGVSTVQLRKMVEDGEVSFADFKKAFFGLSDAGGQFFDLMTKQSTTLPGLFSNISDQMVQLGRTLGTAMLEPLKGIAIGVLSVVTALRGLPQWLNQNKEAFQLLGLAIVAFNSRLIISSAVSLFSSALTAMRTAITASTVAMQGLNAAFRANPIGLIVGTVLAGAAAWELFSEKQKEAATIADDFKTAINQTQANVKAEFDNLQKLTEAAKTDVQARQLRIEAMDKANEKYKEFLPKLLTEASNADEIAKAYERINRALTRRVIIQEFEKKQVELIKQELTIEERLARLGDEKQKLINSGKAEQETSAGTIETAASHEIELNKTPLIADLDFIKMRLKELEEQKNRLLGQYDEPNAEAPVTISDKQRKAAEKAAKSAAELYAEVQKLETENIKAGATKATDELIMLEIQEKELLTKIDEGWKHRIINQAQYQELMSRAQNEFKIKRLKIEDEANAEILAKQMELAAKLAALQKKLMDETFAFLKAQRAHMEEIAKNNGLSIDYSPGVEEIYNKLAAARRKQMDANAAGDSAESFRQMQIIKDLQKQLALYLTLTDAQRDSLKLQQDLADVETRLQTIQLTPEEKAALTKRKGEIQAEMRQLDIQIEINLSHSPITGIDTLRKKIHDVMQGLFKDVQPGHEFSDLLGNAAAQIAKAFGASADAAAKMGAAVSQTFDNILSLQQQVIQGEMAITAAQIAQTQARMNNIQNGLNSANAARSKYSVKELQAEQTRLNELNKQQRKYANEQRNIAIIELVANSVVAVAKAASEGGIAAPFTIAATLIALAAGIAAATSQANSASIPTAAKGGVVGQGALNVRGGGLLQGPSHASGGVLIEAEGGERIFSRQTSQRFHPLFESIAAMEARGPSPSRMQEALYHNFMPKIHQFEAGKAVGHRVDKLESLMSEMNTEMRMMRRDMATKSPVIQIDGKTIAQVVNQENKREQTRQTHRRLL